LGVGEAKIGTPTVVTVDLLLARTHLVAGCLRVARTTGPHVLPGVEVSRRELRELVLVCVRFGRSRITVSWCSGERWDQKGGRSCREYGDGSNGTWEIWSACG